MLFRNRICHVKLFCVLNMEKISVLWVFKKRKKCVGTPNYYTTAPFNFTKVMSCPVKFFENTYLVPPVYLVLKVIKHLRVSNSQGTLVVPH